MSSYHTLDQLRCLKIHAPVRRFVPPPAGEEVLLQHVHCGPCLVSKIAVWNSHPIPNSPEIFLQFVHRGTGNGSSLGASVYPLAVVITPAQRLSGKRVEESRIDRVRNRTDDSLQPEPLSRQSQPLKLQPRIGTLSSQYPMGCSDVAMADNVPIHNCGKSSSPPHDQVQ